MKNKEQYKKDIHHIHDKSYKDLYSKKEIAIDLFKSLLNEEWTKYLTKESLTLVNKSFVTSDYRMPLRFKGNSTHISSLSKFQ